MVPSLSTPTPRRFLLPKRSTQSSQASAALPRFQSTPRFGSSSAPRPTQSRELDIEDDEDDEDDDREQGEQEEQEEEHGSDHSSLGDKDVAQGGEKHGLRADAIDIESDSLTASQEGSLLTGREAGLGDHESIEIDSPILSDPRYEYGSPVEREPKRRRVSISPAPITSPPGEMVEDVAKSDDSEQASIQETDDGASEMSMSDSQHSGDDTRTPHQPVFQPAPRFKPVDVDDAFEGLPAAFSPQRRGSRYLVGGMAAELQGWLSEVKGWGGADEGADSSMKIHVEEVRPGKRMCLVKGHVGPDEESRRWILAGEGKLTGLGRRVEVKLGSVVMVGQPVWDVELEGDTWTVACDWSVESA